MLHCDPTNHETNPRERYFFEDVLLENDGMCETPTSEFQAPLNADEDNAGECWTDATGYLSACEKESPNVFLD